MCLCAWQTEGPGIHPQCPKQNTPVCKDSPSLPPMFLCLILQSLHCGLLGSGFIKLTSQPRADSPAPGNLRVPAEGNEDLDGEKSHGAPVGLRVGGEVMAFLSLLLASWYEHMLLPWQTGQTSQQAGFVVPERRTGQNRILSTEHIFKIIIING